MTRGRQGSDRTRYGRKPKPPAHLTPAESAIWTATCGTQDLAWCELAAAGPILEMYCVALAHYRLLVATRNDIQAKAAEGAHEISDTDTEKKLRALTVAISDAMPGVAALATKLRLTHQARQDAKAHSGQGANPWEDLDETG